MRQAVMTAPGRIEFRDVARPTVAADQVLIAVKRIGICGSDIHVFHGRHPYTRYPVVQGHEVAGAVAAMGDRVVGLAPGDPVESHGRVGLRAGREPLARPVVWQSSP